MASTFTTRMRYEKQADGENSNTWGVKVNTVWDLIDEARGGFLSKSVAGASDVTLTANNSATDENRQAVIDFTGLLTGNINVIVQTAESWWLIQNSTTGSFTLTVKTSAGTGIVVTQGEWAILYSDGTDVKKVLATDDFIAGPSSSTDRSLVLFDGTTGKLLKDGPALGSSGNVLTSNGAGSDPTFQSIPLNVVDDTTPQLGGVLDTNAFAIDESEGANIASAATTDIWATTGNTMHITGTTTITNLGTPSKVGAWRKVIFDGILTLTNGANLVLPGSADITTAPNDFAFCYADTSTQTNVVYFKVDGTAVVSSVGPSQATQAAIEAETNEDTYLPPDLLKHNPGVAKVWLKFTVTGSVDASLNVTSVTDTAVGDWTVNIATDFSSLDYSIAVTMFTTSVIVGGIGTVDGQTAGTFGVEAFDDTGVQEDPSARIYAIAFGDQ